MIIVYNGTMKNKTVIILLCIILLVCILASFLLGRYKVPFRELVSVLAARFFSVEKPFRQRSIKNVLLSLPSGVAK